MHTYIHTTKEET